VENGIGLFLAIFKLWLYQIFVNLFHD